MGHEPNAQHKYSRNTPNKSRWEGRGRSRSNLLEWLKIAPALALCHLKAYAQENESDHPLERVTVCPAGRDTFRALELLAPEDVRVVYLSDDMYLDISEEEVREHGALYLSTCLTGIVGEPRAHIDSIGWEGQVERLLKFTADHTDAIYVCSGPRARQMLHDVFHGQIPANRLFTVNNTEENK